ncbi:MAG: HPr family phosphocarrier protein [Candidatus Omnitrophica bacterium]|nr:HPr family phosphocarrier protein [Candidatus Omnitrophota bacterium]
MDRVGEPLIQAIEIIMPTHLGFHLRVVARFVMRVRQFRSVIRVRKGKITADGKNVLGLLLLAAAWNSKLHIEAEGDDAEEAIVSIKDFFQVEGP